MKFSVPERTSSDDDNSSRERWQDASDHEALVVRGEDAKGEENTRLGDVEMDIPSQSMEEIVRLLAQQALDRGRPKHMLPHPKPYTHEDKTQFPQFRTLLIAKLRTDGDAIGDENNRVWYAFGRLEGKAATRIHPWVQAHQDDPIRFTAANLLQQMTLAFENPNAEAEAETRLATMRQKNRPLGEFISDFDQTLLTAGAHTWNNAQKCIRLRHAVREDLQDIMIGKDVPDDYEDLCRYLLRTDHQIRERQLFRRMDRQNASVPPNMAPTATTSTGTGSAGSSQAMDWEPSANKSRTRRAAWVSGDEIGRRRKEDRCLRCGAGGHMIKECPYAPARPPQAKINNAAVGPLLEDDNGVDGAGGTGTNGGNGDGAGRTGKV